MVTSINGKYIGIFFLEWTNSSLFSIIYCLLFFLFCSLHLHMRMMFPLSALLGSYDFGFVATFLWLDYNTLLLISSSRSVTCIMTICVEAKKKISLAESRKQSNLLKAKRGGSGLCMTCKKCSLAKSKKKKWGGLRWGFIFSD